MIADLMAMFIASLFEIFLPSDMTAIAVNIFNSITAKYIKDCTEMLTLAPPSIAELSLFITMVS
ncbi:hypothetical protein ECSTECS1191_3357 [Escherichia coli STEC_S1191]|nr:hypothetical protein ECSTECS1191_3361 [Escherichia coli STEC_S1191]EGX17535.1 hypothetical protein ECSTECS1191_3357 [Escherichia coli STEC_S1191]PBR15823.1 hypothetical protein COD28_16185 [Escherichia coli]